MFWVSNSAKLNLCKYIIIESNSRRNQRRERMEAAKTFKAVMLEAPGNVQLVDLPFPELAPGQILVKMAYTQINPSDLICMEFGFFYGRSGRAVIGLEGSGIVTKIGPDVPAEYQGAQVIGGVSQGLIYGSWAEYLISDYRAVYLIKENLSLEDSSALIVNPFTVVGMVDLVQKRGLKSTSIYPATSQLGRQFVKLCTKQGIEVISIVRTAARVKQAQEEFGMKHVLAYDDAEFETKYKELSAKLDARVCFESVGGKATMRLLSQLPKNSTVVNFGVLDSPNIENVNALQLLTERKSIEGFLLFHYAEDLGEKASEVHVEMVQKNYAGCFDLGPREVFELKDWQAAVEKAKNLTTGVKILLKLN